MCLLSSSYCLQVTCRAVEHVIQIKDCIPQCHKQITKITRILWMQSLFMINLVLFFPPLNFSDLFYLLYKNLQSHKIYSGNIAWHDKELLEKRDLSRAKPSFHSLLSKLGQRGKKKSCLVVLHHLPLIIENWKKKITVQKYTASNFQNSKKVVFFL